MLGALCQCCLAQDAHQQDEEDIMRQPFPVVNPAQYSFKLDSSNSIHSFSSNGSNAAVERERWKQEVKAFISEAASDKGFDNFEFYKRDVQKFVPATFRLDRSTNSCRFVGDEYGSMCVLDLPSVCVMRCSKPPEWFPLEEADARTLTISFRQARNREELVLRFPSIEARQRFLVSVFVLVQIRKRAQNNLSL